MKVQPPECFTLSVEFISLCSNLAVTWQFNEKYISDDDKYMITIMNIKHSHYKTSLKIAHSSENDMGTYTVAIISTNSSVSVNISVKIISKFLMIFMLC